MPPKNASRNNNLKLLIIAHTLLSCPLHQALQPANDTRDQELKPRK